MNQQHLCRASARRRDPLTTSDSKVEAALGEAIAQRIGEPRYKLWFEHKTKLSWQADCFLVGVANHFAQEWLEKRFTDHVATAVSTVLGQSLPVRFAIDSELFRAARRDQAEAGAIGEPPSHA